MRHLGRIGLGPWLAHKAEPGHAGLGSRWKSVAPLVGISIAALAIGLSGGKRTAREPASVMLKRVDLESARSESWRPPAPADPSLDTPYVVPAKVSPSGNILRIQGPPMVIEVRIPKAAAKTPAAPGHPSK